MNKLLKIGGIVLGIIVILIVVIGLFSKTFLGSSTNTPFVGDTPRSYNKLTTGFSNPMQGEKMTIPSDSGSYGGNVVPQNLPPTDKKIIKNGNLSLKIDSVDDAMVKMPPAQRSFDLLITLILHATIVNNKIFVPSILCV